MNFSWVYHIFLQQLYDRFPAFEQKSLDFAKLFVTFSGADKKESPPQMRWGFFKCTYFTRSRWWQAAQWPEETSLNSGTSQAHCSSA